MDTYIASPEGWQQRARIFNHPVFSFPSPTPEWEVERETAGILQRRGGMVGE